MQPRARRRFPSSSLSPLDDQPLAWPRARASRDRRLYAARQTTRLIGGRRVVNSSKADEQRETSGASKAAAAAATTTSVRGRRVRRHARKKRRQQQQRPLERRRLSSSCARVRVRRSRARVCSGCTSRRRPFRSFTLALGCAQHLRARARERARAPVRSVQGGRPRAVARRVSARSLVDATHRNVRLVRARVRVPTLTHRRSCLNALFSRRDRRRHGASVSSSPSPQPPPSPSTQPPSASPSASTFDYWARALECWPTSPTDLSGDDRPPDAPPPPIPLVLEPPPPPYSHTSTPLVGYHTARFGRRYLPRRALVTSTSPIGAFNSGRPLSPEANAATTQLRSSTWSPTSRTVPPINVATVATWPPVPQLQTLRRLARNLTLSAPSHRLHSMGNSGASIFDSRSLVSSLHL